MTGDLSNTGPMCRTALDCALMMNVIARPDPRDAYACRTTRRTMPRRSTAS